MHHIKFFGLVKLSDSNVKCNSYTNKFNLVFFFLRVKGSGLFFFFFFANQKPCQSFCMFRFAGLGLVGGV